MHISDNPIVPNNDNLVSYKPRDNLLLAIMINSISEKVKIPTFQENQTKKKVLSVIYFECLSHSSSDCAKKLSV